ncbi:MAG: response regulator [Myxococcales bacterium]|jgi:twitching motility two-component system response regulator PilG
MKILIVEDTKTITSLLQVYLMGWGLEFVEAKDGEEGLRKARAEKPDLIISDVRMPVMDGFELCAAIRSDKELHATPVLLLTTLKDDASRQKGKLVGATAFLSKPVAVEELREKVGQILRLPNRR